MERSRADRSIPESDWKRWRALSRIALERYCAKVLQEVAENSSWQGSAHERYKRLFKLLDDRDDIVAEVFNDQRRSTAYQRMYSAIFHKVISFDELAEFTEESQRIFENWRQEFRG